MGCRIAFIYVHTALRLEREEKTQYLDELKQRKLITIDSEAELLRRAFQSKNSARMHSEH
jgi:hypothetical protein